jgi:sugar diacid utilization regulator
MQRGSIEADDVATLAQRNRELQRRLELQCELTRLAMTGSPWRDLVAEFEQRSGLHVTVELVEKRPSPHAAAIVAGGEDIGWVTPALDDPPGEGATELVEHLAGLIGLELGRDRAVFAVEWELRGDLLAELLETDVPTPSVQRRAAQLGADLSQLVNVLLLAPAAENLADPLLRAVRRALRDVGAGKQALAGVHGHRVGAVLPAGVEPDELVARLRHLDPEAGLWTHASAAATRASFSGAAREAEAALGLAASGGGRGQQLVRYEDLGPMRFMLDARDTSQMVDVVEQYLGALAEHDRTKRSDLLKTLEVFLETGGHHRTTAERCYIHGSTVKYRLGLIRTIVGQPLSDPQVRFELGVAYALRKVLRSLGADPLQ